MPNARFCILVDLVVLTCMLLLEPKVINIKYFVFSIFCCNCVIIFKVV